MIFTFVPITSFALTDEGGSGEDVVATEETQATVETEVKSEPVEQKVETDSSIEDASKMETKADSFKVAEATAPEPTAEKTKENIYNVKFKNWDGSILSDLWYAKGVVPVPPENPTKSLADGNKYVFKGWNATVVANKKYTYTAQFDKVAMVFDLNITCKTYLNNELFSTYTMNPIHITGPTQVTAKSDVWFNEITKCTKVLIDGQQADPSHGTDANVAAVKISSKNYDEGDTPVVEFFYEYTDANVEYDYTIEHVFICGDDVASYNDVDNKTVQKKCAGDSIAAEPQVTSINKMKKDIPGHPELKDKDWALASIEVAPHNPDPSAKKTVQGDMNTNYAVNEDTGKLTGTMPHTDASVIYYYTWSDPVVEPAPVDPIAPVITPADGGGAGGVVAAVANAAVGGYSLTAIPTERTPLANSILDSDCCILHLIMMLLALIALFCYTSDMKRRQAKIQELEMILDEE